MYLHYVIEDTGRRRFTVGAGIGQAQGELQQGLDRIKERMVESPHKDELQQGLDRIKERMIISGIANSNDHTDEMAFKAINDAAGISGVVPTLLVYGALPQLSEYDAPAPSVSQRSGALKKATAEIQKLRAKRQVENALNTRNGPSTNDIHELTLNADVLVWREGNTGQLGGLQGPYKLVAMEGESCVLVESWLPRSGTYRATHRSWSNYPQTSVILRSASVGDQLWQRAQPILFLPSYGSYSSTCRIKHPRCCKRHQERLRRGRTRRTRHLEATGLHRRRQRKRRPSMIASCSTRTRGRGRKLLLRLSRFRNS
jgi:hypothetical protein